MVEECIKMKLSEPEYNYNFQSVQVIFYKIPHKNTKELIIRIPKNLLLI